MGQSTPIGDKAVGPRSAARKLIQSNDAKTVSCLSKSA